MGACKAQSNIKSAFFAYVQSHNCAINVKNLQKRGPKVEKYVKSRHKFFFAVARPIVRMLARKWHFKTKTAKLPKKQNYLILSNHQSYLDPAFIALTIKHPIYFVTSDTLYSKKWYIKLLFYCFAPIKKRRGFADTTCIRAMRQIAKEGGNVAIFPEGNRQWNDSMFYLDVAVVKLVRLIKLPLILYNIHGGYGVQPRWSKSKRKGKHTGAIKEIIPWEDIVAMSDDELYHRIVAGLKVIDSDSGELYKSNERAEYLERQLFVCPECGAESTLYSQGNDVHCKQCGLTVTYGENLRLSSPSPNFHFDKLVDWYEFQQQYVRNYDLTRAGIIFSDDNVALYDKSGNERILVAQGKLVLTKDKLSIGECEFSTSEIYGGCGQDGDKFSFNIDARSYLVVGGARFNSIKYLLMFNRVCKLIAEKGGDKYYGLYLDPALR